MIEVGVKETTTTVGTGVINLTASTNHARVSDAFPVGTLVGYCIISGNGDKEWGLGFSLAGNTFSRDWIHATLVGTTYNRLNPTPLNLTGTSTLICTENTDISVTSKPMVSSPFMSQYVSPFLATNNSGGTFTVVSNRTYAIPFLAPMYCNSLTGTALVVTTLSAGTAYVGVAESSRVSGGYVPGKLLGQSQIDVGTTGIKSDTVNYIPKLTPGHLYWALMNCTSGPVVRGISLNSLTPMMGLGTDGINPWTYLFASQTGPIPSDLSAVTFSAATAGSAIPNILFTV